MATSAKKGSIEGTTTNASLMHNETIPETQDTEGTEERSGCLAGPSDYRDQAGNVQGCLGRIPFIIAVAQMSRRKWHGAIASGNGGH